MQKNIIFSVYKFFHLLCWLLLLGFLGACTNCQKYRWQSLSPESVRNASYRSEFSQQDRILLSSGKYVEAIVPGSASRLTVHLSDQMAFGDMDSDRVGDAAVVLISNAGGSGTFYHLVAMLNRKGIPHFTDSVLLGDRIELQSVRIKKGLIEIGMLVQGPHDPMTKRTVKTVKTYRLKSGKLLEIEQP